MFQDFILPKNLNHVEDDKAKIKRLEHELGQIKQSNKRLNERCDNLQSENFALKIQLNEFNGQQTVDSFLPSFAQVLANSKMPTQTLLKPTKLSNGLTLNSPTKKATTPENKNIFPSFSTKVFQESEPPKKQMGSGQAKVPRSKPLDTLNCVPSPSLSHTPKQNVTQSKKQNFQKPTSFTNFRHKAKTQNVLKSADSPKKSPQKVMIYHASNLEWSHPSTIEEAVKRIDTFGPHPIKDVKVEKIFTPRLEDTIREIKSRDHSNAVVLISVLTNNAKAHQNIYQTKALLQEALELLKKQISQENIIFLESPPSLKFYIHPYNLAMFHVCRSNGVFFAPNLLQPIHIKPDGLHILNQFKHLMVKSVSAAIKKVDPKKHYGLFLSGL